MSIADFALASIAYSSFFNEANAMHSVQSEIVSKFPELEAYFKGLGEELKEYLSTRRSSPW